MSDTQTMWQQGVRTLQIVTGSLAFGAVSFLVIGWVIASGSDADDSTLTFVGAILALASMASGGLAAKLMTDNALRQKPASERGDYEMLALYTTKTVVRFAILEGASLFNVIAYMMEANPWSIGFAAGLIVVMAMGFPTESVVRAWIERQRRGTM